MTTTLCFVTRNLSVTSTDVKKVEIEFEKNNLEVILQESFTTFVAAGGTGEMYSLDREEYIAVVQSAVKVTEGRMPVIAGVGYGSRIAVSMATEAAKAGAAALLILPPYYPNPAFEGLAAYCKAIGNATNLPMLIYTRDWLNLSAEQAEKIAEKVPTLVGWKDGQGELRNFQRIRSRLGERFTWIGGVGDDHVSGYYGIGVRRYTSSISAVAPKLSILLHEVAAARDEGTLAAVTDKHVLPLYNLRTRCKGYEVSAMNSPRLSSPAVLRVVPTTWGQASPRASFPAVLRVVPSSGVRRAAPLPRNRNCKGASSFPLDFLRKNCDKQSCPLWDSN